MNKADVLHLNVCLFCIIVAILVFIIISNATSLRHKIFKDNGRSLNLSRKSKNEISQVGREFLHLTELDEQLKEYVLV